MGLAGAHGIGVDGVQIAESVAGRRRIVRHVGSARDEAGLGLLMGEAQRLLMGEAQRLLMEEARRLLEDDRQGVLDPGITPQARRAAMVPAAGQPALSGGGLAPGAQPEAGTRCCRCVIGPSGR